MVEESRGYFGLLLDTLEETLAWQAAFAAVWSEIWEWKMQFAYTGLPDWTRYLSRSPQVQSLLLKAENLTLRRKLAETRQKLEKFEKAKQPLDFLRRMQKTYPAREDLVIHLKALAEAIDPTQPDDSLPLTGDELEGLRYRANLCELGNHAMAAASLKRLLALTRRPYR